MPAVDPPRPDYTELKSAAVSVLQDHLADPSSLPSDLHDRLGRLSPGYPYVEGILEELSLEPSPRLRETARWLVRYGTDLHAVRVGLGLFRGNAEQCDIAELVVVGLLSGADQLALAVLATIPGAESGIIWLAARSREAIRSQAAQFLVNRPDPLVQHWVRSTPRHLLRGQLARQIAETHRLAVILSGPTVSDARWDQTGNLLLAMMSARDDDAEIGNYADAAEVCCRWVALAGQRPPTLDRAAVLASVAEDLRTGAVAPVVDERRGELLDRIEEVLSAQPWVEMLESSRTSGDRVVARRARWIAGRPAPREGLTDRFAVRVVVEDPDSVGYPQVEARIVIDGMPIVVTAFGKGRAAPESLLDSGGLRATADPNQIRLAEAHCAEECCGGLHVTVLREGLEVVWTGWRSSKKRALPSEMRFDADAYDREVARAEQDRRWEWPARTVARLVRDGLRDDPIILGRWGCRLDWCDAWLYDYDTVRVGLHYPAHPVVNLVVDVGARAAESVAGEILEMLRSADPRSIAWTGPPSGP
ncbi:hypothetical protein ACFC06_03375 [Nocardia sp. NPDC056064]|uniref:hypothetical protein n=1 Tax=Nocardia sp. NPDC056064 TaxID=3345701 RepID=UPI0035DE5DD2